MFIMERSSIVQKMTGLFLRDQCEIDVSNVPCRVADDAQSRKGNIINVASAASSIKAAPNRFVYMSTKPAVIGLTKAIAADFIRRHSLQRDMSRNGAISSLAQRMHSQAILRKPMLSFCFPPAMGRLGVRKKLLHCGVLASDEAVLLVGKLTIIDGGWVL